MSSSEHDPHFSALHNSGAQCTLEFGGKAKDCNGKKTKQEMEMLMIDQLGRNEHSPISVFTGGFCVHQWERENKMIGVTA